MQVRPLGLSASYTIRGMSKVLSRTLLALLFAVVVTGGFAWLVNERAAYTFFSATLIMLFAHHAWMVAKLTTWLRAPKRETMPRRGAWSELFTQLYELYDENRRTRDRLTDALLRFRQAGSALPDGVITFDENDTVDWLNASARKHFTISNIDLEQRQLGYLGTLRNEFIPALAQIRASRPYTPVRVERELPDGQSQVLLLTRVRFGSGQGLILSRDVTVSEQLDKMKRDFVANVSHELRTPLTVLRGFAETMQDLDESDVALQRSSLNRMVEQAQRMQRLVEDLLTLSRLEDAQTPMQAEQVPLASIVRSIQQDVTALSAGRHTITSHIEDVSVRGSAEELRSAFFNLATNAVRYTPEGGGVEINLAVEEGTGMVRYSVKDTGDGIAPEHLPRLTERFYRVDKGRSRRNSLAGGGTGLGLSIVKHIMMRHRGKLEIASELGKGSTFSCTLPLA
jgi:two-component system, OmpR family, phosphate regulon sensor histidine kinase PhoR